MPGDLGSELILQEAEKKKTNEIVLHYSPGALSSKKILQFIKDAQASNIHISFILPVPVFEQHIPKSLWDNIDHEANLPLQTIEDYYRVNDELISALGHSKQPIKIYDVASIFCKNRCLVSFKNGKPVYFDSSHLTLSGAVLLEPVFDKLFITSKST